MDSLRSISTTEPYGRVRLGKEVSAERLPFWIFRNTPFLTCCPLLQPTPTQRYLYEQGLLPKGTPRYALFQQSQRLRTQEVYSLLTELCWLFLSLYVTFKIRDKLIESRPKRTLHLCCCRRLNSDFSVSIYAVHVVNWYVDLAARHIQQV